jgi:flagellar biosynthesis regulator FlaF
MPTFPAICDSCGTIFSSGAAGNATMINCKAGPCPACGGIGSVPDGTYQTTGNVIRLFATSQRSRQQLQAIVAAVNRAREESQNAAAAIEQLKFSAPELSSIADTLPKTRNELYAFLTLILTALGVLIASAGLWKDKGPSDQEIQRMIDQTLKEATKPPPDRRGNTPQVRTSAKVGRNATCPCGSGRKFKRCCLLNA